jgi:hypothetical protein
MQIENVYHLIRNVDAIRKTVGPHNRDAIAKLRLPTPGLIGKLTLAVGDNTLSSRNTENLIIAPEALLRGHVGAEHKRLHSEG